MKKRAGRAPGEEQQGWRVEAYKTARGTDVYLEFLDGLSQEDREESHALVEALRRLGSALRRRPQEASAAGSSSFEEHRSASFYCFRPGRKAVLLGGFVKKRRDIPADVLKLMRKRMDELEGDQR